MLLRQGGSLSPRSLVHDALLKLYHSEVASWDNERHFRAVAAMAMKQILIDRARRARTEKHGGAGRQVSLTGIGREDDPVDLITLVTALEGLELARPRASSVVEHRLLGGMELPEIATELGVSLSTTKREWRVGQAWLQRALSSSR